LLCFLILLGISTQALADVRMRLSVKVFTDANGRRPPATITNRVGGVIVSISTNALGTDQQIREQVALANRILWGKRRGYAIDVTEIVVLPSSVSQWFNVDPRDGTGKTDLEKAAESSQSLYAYRDDALNLYINNNTSSGSCSLLTGDIIFIGQGVRDTTIGHEVGHYFGLGHTQGYLCGRCDENPLPDIEDESAPFNLCDSPQPDLIDDTLPDRACWNQNDIARFSFNNFPYGNLSPFQQAQVDNVFFNLMSYHDNRNRLTDDQMDRWVDFAHTQRSKVVSGGTTYVDNLNGCGIPEPLNSWINQGLVNPPFNPFQWGTRLSVGQSFRVNNPFNGQSVEFNFCLGGPYQTLKEGIDRAANGNVIAIRGGVSYNEKFTIRKPVTLTAYRALVRIGR